MKLKLLVLSCVLGLVAAAQTLHEFKDSHFSGTVQVTGTLADPQITNNTNRSLRFVTVMFKNSEGIGPVKSLLFAKHPEGLKPGASTSLLGNVSNIPPDFTVVSIQILNVVLDKGEFIGSDRGAEFNAAKKQLKDLDVYIP